MTSLEGSNEDEHPTKVHLYVNRRNLGFEDIDDVEPEQTLHLEAKHVEGRESILLKPFKFKKVWTLTLYVEESGGGNVSSIGGIQVVGNPL